MKDAVKIARRTPKEAQSHDRDAVNFGQMTKKERDEEELNHRFISSLNQ
ncbi:MAG TPA: hypothetical protein VIQ24_18520 [Pyrinomonadaceae bacterium]